MARRTEGTAHSPKNILEQKVVLLLRFFFIVISVDDSFFRKCTLFTNCTFLNLTILTFYVLNLCYITCPSEITDLINRSVARLKLLVGQ